MFNKHFSKLLLISELSNTIMYIQHVSIWSPSKQQCEYMFLYNEQEQFENTKGVSRINNLQTTSQKTKDRATRIHFKQGSKLIFPRNIINPANPLILFFTAKQHDHHLIWISCWTPLNMITYIQSHGQR
jgi:hypothetical protein